MSFRYSNHLVGALKHRLLLESAHRRIATSVYTAECNGVVVRLSGYSTVLSIELAKEAGDSKTSKWDVFYRTQNNNNNKEGSASSSLNLDKLSDSIRTAVWLATQKIQSAKEDAHHQAMRYNHVKRGESDALEKWYEHDATVLHPLPFNGLKNETATPWVQGVRFGLSATELEALRNKTNNNNNNKKEYRVTALQEKHLSTEHIPMASVHPLYTAGLLPLETDQENTDIRPLFNNHNNPLARPNANRSRINVPYVLSQQRREMALDEEKFWERVELIRKSQQATTPAVKRPYQGDSSVDGLSTVVKENVEESVQLKFNQ